MAFKIGFLPEVGEKIPVSSNTVPQPVKTPRKSVVEVYFAERRMMLSYYNDRFDLHRGDWVYVDGKLEGMLGRVNEVNYNFKIKISDYKRVVAVADTAVHGQFYMAGSHFVTFDREALPSGKVATWFKAPVKEDDEFVSGSDDTTFRLNDIKDMNVSAVTAQSGRMYYEEDRVKYICIDGNVGYAVVEGSKNYEIEFEYNNGEISRLTCSCFCSSNCKHKFAAMLQLKEILELIAKNYADEYEHYGYFAAIQKATFFTFAVDGREKVSFTL